MKKISPNFYVCCLLLLFASGCASKRQKETYGPKFEPAPVAGPQLSLPDPESISPAPMADPKHESAHIALVVGGAGVASFATVGILKRFREEGIKVDLIVANGWPAIFSVAYGFLPSVHDLEWFAMRLTEKDLARLGSMDSVKELDTARLAPGVVETTFKQRTFEDMKLPVVVSSSNIDFQDRIIFDRGDWRQALFATCSVPGIYRKFPKQEVASMKAIAGLDFAEAERRWARITVAVDMYTDYLAFYKATRSEYLTHLGQSLNEAAKSGVVFGRVSLGKAPNELSARRTAIRAGYREATRLAKEIRARVSKGE